MADGWVIGVTWSGTDGPDVTNEVWLAAIAEEGEALSAVAGRTDGARVWAKKETTQATLAACGVKAGEVKKWL